MQYIFVIMTILFGTMNLMSCGVCNDCEPVAWHYKYINKSTYDVELEVKSDYDNDNISQNTATIVKDDSVTITYTVGAPPDYLFFLDSSFVVKFKFLSEPEKCLTYSGAIVDSLDDPRSEWYVDVYTIDDSLYFKADYTCQ